MVVMIQAGPACTDLGHVTQGKRVIRTESHAIHLHQGAQGQPGAPDRDALI
jgi:hypothetical protein